MRWGNEEQDAYVLGVLKTWIGAQLGQLIEPTMKEDFQVHAFLMYTPLWLQLQKKKKNQIYKIYSHFAIAFLTVLAPTVKRNHFLQDA